MVRIGVVGFGGSGTRHALAFSKLAGVTVSSIVDPIQGPELASRIGATFYSQDEDFLEAQNFDALFVATPDAPEPLDAVKVAWAEMMMSHPPVDTLWERPLGLDEQENRTIAASARSAKLAVNYFWRFGVYDSVRDALASGAMDLGEVHSVRVINALNDGLDHKRWRFNRRVHLPVVFLDHTFDLISFLGLPKVSSVRASRQLGSLGSPPMTTDIAWNVDGELENGGRLSISSSQYMGSKEHFRPLSLFDVQGDRGWLRVTQDGAHFIASNGRRVTRKPRTRAGLEDATRAVANYIVREQGVSRQSASAESVSLAQNASHFVRWITGKTSDPFPLATLSDAQLALRAGLKVVRAAESGRAVRMKR